MFTKVMIFDLDETVVNSAHRTPNHPDGTLNLPLYLSMKTRENTMRDTLLPLANVWKALDLSKTYVIVCTARTWSDFDQEFLDIHGLKAHKIVARFTEKDKTRRDAELKTKGLAFLRLKQFAKLPKVMFDDAKPVLKAIREMGIPCLNSHKVNKILAG